MDQWIIDKLSTITEEEQEILNNHSDIDRKRYMEDGQNTVAGSKLLEYGKQITVRPHTRFVHFPEHTHDFVEIVYMCQGETTHLVEGTKVVLRQGELLLLGQGARQEIFPARETDIAVNFIVRPEFFGGIISYLGGDETPMQKTVIQCLRGNRLSKYLHFKVADVKPVQNLVENLLWTLLTNVPNRRSIYQQTMGLLFSVLLNQTDKLYAGNKEETIVQVLHYIEENYACGSLTEIAERLNYDPAWLSRKIKQSTGRNYADMVREKRLAQAAWMLQHTHKKISDIANEVGYENISFFNRIFVAMHGMSPRQYRQAHKEKFFFGGGMQGSGTIKNDGVPDRV